MINILGFGEGFVDRFIGNILGVYRTQYIGVWVGERGEEEWREREKLIETEAENNYVNAYCVKVRIKEEK